MTPISNNFQSEIADLKNNLESLGKYTSCGLVRSKSFLSFDKDGHLKIRELNPLQMLGRCYLGLYRETRLENAILGWNSYQIKHGNVCPELSEKLTSLWLKNNSTPILPPIQKTFFIGNSDIENAEVIGIGQLFSHAGNAQFCNELLAKHHREGDVILVEGIDAGKTISSKHNFQTALMQSATEVYGWEPVGYEELNAQVFDRATTYGSKWTEAQNNFFRNTWDVRQKSLLNEIDYYRELGKRVFVCAGAAHFFPFKGLDNSPVISNLKKHKFTVGLANIKENATYYSFDALRKRFE